MRKIKHSSYNTTITAYARDILLRSSEIASMHGYEVLHGIIDSLWLKGDSDPQKLAEHIGGHIGIPIEIKGVYKWIVFLPCKSIDVGAMNRYYGVFEDGRMKIRGIEARRNDTGEVVQYVLLDSESKNPLKRLKIAELLEGNERYDKGKYVEFLFKAGETLFQPFGYDVRRIAMVANEEKSEKASREVRSEQSNLTSSP